MGMQSKMRRDKKRTQDMRKKGHQILSKKNTKEQFIEKIMAFASFLTTWNGRMIAIKEQVGERMDFFKSKDMPEVVRLCETIIHDIEHIQKDEYPHYFERCKEFRLKLGELSVITDRVEHDMQLMDLMENFHSTRSYMDSVMTQMDHIVRNVHLVLTDEPTLQTPKFTNSTSVDTAPDEEIHVITPEEEFENLKRIGMLPSPKDTDSVIDVSEDEAKAIINAHTNEVPQEDSIIVDTNQIKQ